MKTKSCILLKRFCFIIVLLFLKCDLSVIAQDIFTAGVYFQNFGTTPIAAGAWTNNVSYLGWYTDSPANFLGTINITAAAPANGGGQYMYTCSGGADLKLGTRPSNGSGGGPCANSAASTCGHGLGVRLLNTFGNTIVALNVTYRWYQFSLAENGGNANGMFFCYQKGLTVTSITTGAWTNVAALDFLAPQSSMIAGSNQINGYPCTQTGVLSSCFVVNVPHGTEIMLRWWDPNNSNNDPHLGIDDITVTAYADNICLTPLSIELKSFFANRNNKKGIDLIWKTQTEKNADYFLLEHSADGINFYSVDKVSAFGNSNSEQSYKSVFYPEEPQMTHYFRLKMVDKNGEFKYSKIIASNTDYEITSFKKIIDPNSNMVKLQFELKSAKPIKIRVLDISGKEFFYSPELVFSEGLNEYSIPKTFSKGIYIISVEGLNELTVREKMLITD